MNVLDVMARRASIRSFAPKRPDRVTIEGVLKNACRAPSMTNIQPWRVHVFAGDALADIVNAAAAGENRLIERPLPWAVEAGPPSGETAAQRRGGLRFYEAPVGLICSIRRDADHEDWMAHGAFVYGVSLAAGAFGLDTCIIGDFYGLDDLLSGALPLHRHAEIISLGIGVGYRDEARHAPISRRPLDDFANFAWS